MANQLTNGNVPYYQQGNLVDTLIVDNTRLMNEFARLQREKALLADENRRLRDQNKEILMDLKYYEEKSIDESELRQSIENESLEIGGMYYDMVLSKCRLHNEYQEFKDRCRCKPRN